MISGAENITELVDRIKAASDQGSCRTSRHRHIFKQRIDYKLFLLTYKTLQIQQPTYLYNSLSFPSHSLSTRSSDSSVLSIPYVRTSLGKRAFSVVAPRLWNSLPPDTRNSLSLSTFRSKLKTHLFKLAFPLNSLPSYPAYPDLILVFPLLLALSNDTWY